jgi:hypothetical protein
VASINWSRGITPSDLSHMYGDPLLSMSIITPVTIAQGHIDGFRLSSKFGEDSLIAQYRIN